MKNKERKNNIIKALKRDRDGLERLVESMRPTANYLYQIHRQNVEHYRGAVVLDRNDLLNYRQQVIDEDYVREMLADQMKKTFKPLLVIKEDKSEENPHTVKFVSDVFISFGEEG